jgi:hypothetical protein
MVRSGVMHQDAGAGASGLSHGAALARAARAAGPRPRPSAASRAAG